MSSRDSGVVECEFFRNPKMEWLKDAWMKLETESDCSFFLSWLWIGTWIDCFVDDFSVLEARRDGKIVGLGIIVAKHFPNAKRPLRTKYYLHRTGYSDEDQVWIEYNDFLISRTDTEHIRYEMCSYLTHRLNSGDAFVVGASKPEQFSCMSELGVIERKVWETTNYHIDLNELCKTDGSVLSAISRNARYQIKRSIREYEKVGPISVEKCQTIEGAYALLEIAKPLHLARWGDGLTGSGLANPKFISFHKLLISRGLEGGGIELNHIKAGNDTIGIVYNFKYKNTIYFYFCSMNYKFNSSHFKPGLVSHYLLIDQAIRDKADIYDFMGGTARYKSTFSNRKGKLVVCQYEHPGLFLSVESFARKMKHKLCLS
ncbi:GNAT family N-acetyltransferase [Vibrio sp.]|nr:GNAT family N-acetyltransferase [Vibrio sp.]